MPSVCCSWKTRISHACPLPGGLFPTVEAAALRAVTVQEGTSPQFSGAHAHGACSAGAHGALGSAQCEPLLASGSYTRPLETVLLRSGDSACLFVALEILQVKTDLVLGDFLPLRTFRERWAKELSPWPEILPWASYVSTRLVYSPM